MILFLCSFFNQMTKARQKPLKRQECLLKIFPVVAVPVWSNGRLSGAARSTVQRSPPEDNRCNWNNDGATNHSSPLRRTDLIDVYIWVCVCYSNYEIRRIASADCIFTGRVVEW